MAKISMTAFRAKTYASITRVEAGETLEITRHGKVIAEMVPKSGFFDPLGKRNPRS